MVTRSRRVWQGVVPREVTLLCNRLRCQARSLKAASLSHRNISSGNTSRRHLADVAVFWDYEDCPLSSGEGGVSIVRALGQYARSMGVVSSFRAYSRLVPLSAKSAMMRRGGVTICDCAYDKKAVVHSSMIADMFRWTFDRPAADATNIMVVITAGSSYADAISTLSLSGYIMVVFAPLSAHEKLREVQSAALLEWTDALFVKAHASEQDSSRLNGPNHEQENPLVLGKNIHFLSSTFSSTNGQHASLSTITPVNVGAVSTSHPPANIHTEHSLQSEQYPHYFNPLVQILRQHTQGDQFMWFQQVASALHVDLKNNDVYKQAGVDSFTNYVHMAHQARVIIDDVNKLMGKRYLRLHPRLR
ncbi:uncharacterized protein LAESUDRAFT_719362 [Laetiporus sulphureus 93-53]|uniref:NYN domain-containing protein n=1 Tax=Laetiporus sulphureus 93-53 TaxID=1314785 RepID=A0A165IGQ2_9APHY|nr:uncharacterized protein LAESUDRAFT_719362 [Laetiporus sulphureus 93-53]KZT13048.1 hypothetical protein LAESUDRAFT_719362 [Laetiporus sulphureus 93-53]